MVAQKLVEQALREYPRTRGNDRLLIVCVWTLQSPGWKQEPDKFIAHKAIMPETITRWRRKLQEQGRYLPDAKITEARFKKFEQVKAGNFEEL